jgi:DNA polymerase elongation subunit (family B)
MIVGSEILEDGTLIISYYDQSGKIKVLQKRLPQSELFNWVESKNPTGFKNWDGKHIIRKTEKGQYVSQFRIEEIMRQLLSGSEVEEIFELNFPKKTFIDIEIRLETDEFPDPAKALMPVGLITFVSDDNVSYVLSIMDNEEYPNGLGSEEISKMELEVNEYFRKIEPLKEKGKDDSYLFQQDFKIKHKYFKTEEEMLSFFFHQLVPKFSFVTGWNFTGFDWKYLMNRAKRLKIEAMKNMPSRSVFSKNMIPKHLGILDYMEVFQTTRPYKVVENYKLDYISKLVLNSNKLKHGYSSFFEFQKDAYLYTLYNVIDTLLVKLIEQKLSILDVAFSMSWVARVDINKVYSPVYITEVLICREFLDQGVRMMKLPWDSAEKAEETYTGAFVKEPIPGYYNYVSCYDFKSMYPNIQMQFNISPDSYLGKKDEIKLKGDEITTKNNTCFDGKKDSSVRKILTRLYDERVNTQNEIKKLKSKK